MTDSSRMAENADRLLLGSTHPLLAIVVFICAFVFAGIPFVVQTESPFFIVPCLIGCVSCSILFIRLLIGRLKMFDWLLLACAGILCVFGGPEWYFVAMVTGGTVVCCLAFDRLIGRFRPLVRIS